MRLNEIKLHSLALIKESSPLIRLFYRLWHYSGQELDAREHRQTREQIGVLVAFGADPNAPFTKKRLECFSDGTRLETVEVHSMYECLSRALWNISLASAGPAVVALYRLLTLFGLVFFPPPEIRIAIHKSPSLYEGTAAQILNSRAPTGAKALPPAGLEVTVPSPNPYVFPLLRTDFIPASDRRFAEAVAQQLVAIGCPDNRSSKLPRHPLTLLQLSRLEIRRAVYGHKKKLTAF